MESNKTLVLSFDEWLKEQNQPASNFLRRETYEAGQQSRQDEVDELQKRLSMYERQGYKLVPIEPTEEMIMKSYNDYGDYVGDGLPKDIYKAMIGE